MRNTRLTEVSDEAAYDLNQTAPAPEAPAPERRRDEFENRYADLLAMSLKALSQRATIALASLFTLLLAASAFWLWWSILPAPSVMQLVGVGMYAVFALVLELVRRHR